MKKERIGSRFVVLYIVIKFIYVIIFDKDIWVCVIFVFYFVRKKICCYFYVYNIDGNMMF